MSNWRRVIALVLAGCLLLATASCGQSASPTDSNAAQAVEDEKDKASNNEGGAAEGAEETVESTEAEAGAEAVGTAEAAEGNVTAGETAAEAAVAAGTEKAAETAAETESGTAATDLAAAADTGAGAAGTELAAAADTAAEEIADADRIDYSNEENWAYFGIGEDKDADLFLVCPTVDMKDELNMSMDDKDIRRSFVGALNMERGIYEDSTRMYAPFYRQASMKSYEVSAEEREHVMEIAYNDVSDAFAWYLENKNEGRPIVLAGFSQGSDMCYRLMEEYFGDKALYDQLVAVYAIGWPCTEEMVQKYPQIVPAKSADDIGTVISFNSETPELTESFILPAGVKSYSINPLNWKTDSTPADKSENIGACFTSYSGEIKREEVNLCGCYIDEDRGALKVTDVDPAKYPPVIPFLKEGAYHIYDYQFFYRNLQENVANRVRIYMESIMSNAA